MATEGDEITSHDLQASSGHARPEDAGLDSCDESEACAVRPTDEAIDAVIWATVSIHAQIERMFEAYGEALGVSRPQAMILAILSVQSGGTGLAVKNVAALMQVNGSFVTHQTRLLEQRGLTRRLPSSTDARVVLLALTDHGRERMGALDARRRPACDAAFKGSDDGQFERLRTQLVAIEQRLRVASHMVPTE
jgi:MarR family transcriptional regulator, organic hydroperoxide resistance regulator